VYEVQGFVTGRAGDYRWYAPATMDLWQWRMTPYNRYIVSMYRSLGHWRDMDSRFRGYCRRYLAGR